MRMIIPFCNKQGGWGAARMGEGLQDKVKSQ